jgi:hypothetical protein
MTEKSEPTKRNLQLGEREDSQTRVHIGRHVSSIEIDLVPPRLIRIEGRTSRGQRIERHMKITEKERLVMV